MMSHTAFWRVCEECGTHFSDEDRWDVAHEPEGLEVNPLIPSKFQGLCDSCLYGNKCEMCDDFTLASERFVYDEVDGFYVHCKRCHTDLLLSPEEQMGGL